MRRFLSASLLLLAAATSAAEPVVVATEVPRDTYFVHEPIRLVLRLGIDRALFQDSLVQMFHRALDVPVQVSAPWLEGLPGADLCGMEPPVGQPCSLALNGAEALAGRVEASGGRAEFVLAWTYLPTEPGELLIPAPTVRYAWATRFRDDFVSGRVAVDRRDAVVEGAPLRVAIRPLPEEGRPPRFGGAVGQFTIRAGAAPRVVPAGDVVKLTLVIEGEGNLERFDTPRLDGIAGFHVYGMLDDRDSRRRRVVYDLAPLDASVDAVPPISFAFFDTRPPAGYRTLRTEPIPITVRGTARARQEAPRDTRGGALLILLGAAVLVALTGVVLRWRARRRAVRQDARDAVAVFRARAATPGVDLADALAEFLAAHLQCPPAAVISPDLRRRLTDAGATPELADRAATLLEALVAMRYGASLTTDYAAAVEQVVSDTDHCLRKS